MKATKEYCFENFIVGDSNRFAYEAAKAFTKGKAPYNPLYLYGGSGLGKTHLLISIGLAFRASHPDALIRFVSGQELLIETVRRFKEQQFEKLPRQAKVADLLLVDDFDTFFGKPGTLELVVNAFRDNIEKGLKVAVTSSLELPKYPFLYDFLPKDLPSALCADIPLPNKALRYEIIQQKAAAKGLVLTEARMEMLADKLVGNIRTIEGVINWLSAQKQMNADKFESAVDDICKHYKVSPSPDTIIAKTAEYFSLSPEELKGTSRDKKIVTARKISMALIRHLTTASVKEISELYAEQSSSSVMKAIRDVTDYATRGGSDNLLDMVNGIQL